MPSLIFLVNIVPEAPTSVPATIKAKLLSAKPLAATARLVHALSSEITSGISAPPIGKTIESFKKSYSSSATHKAICRIWNIATYRFVVISETIYRIVQRIDESRGNSAQRFEQHQRALPEGPEHI